MNFWKASKNILNFFDEKKRKNSYYMYKNTLWNRHLIFKKSCLNILQNFNKLKSNVSFIKLVHSAIVENNFSIKIILSTFYN